MSEPHLPSRAVLDQIAALPRSKAPLIVCDVDEVVLHLLRPLKIWLAENGFQFLQTTYKLTGNIARKGQETPLNADEVKRILQSFFDETCDRQEMVDGAKAALDHLSTLGDVVLLTNLPGAHNKPVRQKHLAKLGLDLPLLTNSGPKGGAVAALSAGRPSPVVFIDDSAVNLASVHASLPSAKLVQFIASDDFRASVTPPAHVDLLTGDWQEACDFIESVLPLYSNQG